MLNKIIKRIKRSKSLYGNLSSSTFYRYLKNNGVSLGEGVLFRYPKSTKIDLTRPSLISIGDNVDINEYFTIMTHDFGTYVFRNLYNDFIACSGRVTIGNNIYIGRNVTVLRGVTIGDNCIIGLGSVVTKDIPSNSVAVGVPYRRICTIEEYYEKRKELQKHEAIDYGISIVERFKRAPKLSDFREEWVLFTDKENIVKYPELERSIKFRFKTEEKRTEFLSNNEKDFEDFESFLKVIYEEYKKRHSIN